MIINGKVRFDNKTFKVYNSYINSTVYNKFNFQDYNYNNFSNKYILKV